MKEKEYIRDGRAPIPLNLNTSKIMSSNKGKNTKPELLLRRALWSNSVRGYRLHWKKVPGSPDIAFPGKKIGIYVNGCYWHRCPHCELPLPKSNSNFWEQKFRRNVERDKKKIEELEELEWITITVWECQISSNLERVIKKIKEVLKVK